jgi:8-oxo-dGTP diphosphatase
LTGWATALARGPWRPDDVSSVWHQAPYQPAPRLTRLADAEVDRLRSRGSPAHDGMAARLAAFDAGDSCLRLELQPARWALRLLDETRQSLVTVCVVRSQDGRWLAGRRATWVSTWAGRWALGAAGAVEVGESPVETLTRELQEEWGLEPDALSVEALIRLPNELVMLVGVATVADDCNPVPDAEHDEWAWWPENPAGWPHDAHDGLRLMATLL